MLINKRKTSINLSSLLLSAGISLFIINIVNYPQMLPNIISNENDQIISISVFVFYFLYTISIISIIIGLNRIIKKSIKNQENILVKNSFLIKDKQDSTPNNRSEEQRFFRENENNRHPVWRIFLEIFKDKKLFYFFILSSLIYSIFYSIISSSIIINPNGNISTLYGIEKLPYIIMTEYGPIGYVPSISIYLNEYLGIFIIPTNLLLNIIISILVGFNASLSYYSYKLYYLKNKKEKFLQDTNINLRNKHNNNSSSSIEKSKNKKLRLVTVAGMTTGLFTTCPTCASFYLLSIFTGSFSTGIVSIIGSSQIIFLLLSFSILIISPFIIAINLKRNTEKRREKCNFKLKK